MTDHRIRMHWHRLPQLGQHTITANTAGLHHIHAIQSRCNQSTSTSDQSNEFRERPAHASICCANAGAVSSKVRFYAQPLGALARGRRISTRRRGSRALNKSSRSPASSSSLANNRSRSSPATTDAQNRTTRQRPPHTGNIEAIIASARTRGQPSRLPPATLTPTADHSPTAPPAAQQCPCRGTTGTAFDNHMRISATQSQTTTILGTTR